MTVDTPIQKSVVTPEPAEESQLQELEQLLEELVAAGRRTAKLISADGHEIEIPPSAFEALRFVADGMAHGLTMVLIPQGKELTTQQAADLLHVSRPHLIKLLDEETIPFHRVGSHRRLKMEDVLAYRDQRNSKRRKELQRLTELSEEMPGGYS